MSGSVFVWNTRFFSLPNGIKERLSGAASYFSGALFTIGWWLFIDGIMVNSKLENPIKIGLEDWIPGLLCTLGMLITNSLDLSILTDDSYEYGSSGLANRAKLFLFVGIALIAGGVSGSFAILVIKYLNSAEGQNSSIYAGVTSVAQTLLISLSTFTLWLFNRADNSTEFNFVLQ